MNLMDVKKGNNKNFKLKPLWAIKNWDYIEGYL